MAYIQDVLTGVQIQPSADGLETFIHLSQGENGRKLYIKILGIDEIPAGSVATISGTKPDGNVYSAAGTIDDITIVFNEDVQMTVVAGIWDANVRIVNGGNVIASAKLRFVIHESAVAPGAVPSDSQLDGILAECQMYAETARSAAYGSPLTASAAADMIDTSKVYVYTGDETGYTAGHWYYYDGSAWADGGVYNSIAIQTDTTLTLPDHAADAKATGDKLATKADRIGNIPVAEALRGGVYTPNAEPYHFRKSPSGGAKDEVIVGGSLGWNQLVKNGNFESAIGWYISSGAPSVSDNVASYTASSDGTMSLTLNRAVDVIVDHKVLAIGEVWCDSNNEYRIRYPFISSKISTTASTWTAVKFIGVVSSGSTSFGIQSNSINGALYKYRNAMLIDLTILFGSTIADHIYTLEQATAGSGVAWVKQYIDLDSYHEYSAPTIKSVEGLVSHDVVGFNVWDEETQAGYYSSSNGNHASSSSQLCSKNFIHVLPNTQYCFGKSYNLGDILYYDVDKNFISADINKGANYLFTTPSNCHFIQMNLGSTYGNTYNHDICINLSDPSKNGTYEPYEKHSYPLDSSLELRGIPKLSDGKMYFDGDAYQSDGQVVRRYGVVDLGTLTYAKNTASNYSYYSCREADISDRKAGSSLFLCSKYITVSPDRDALASGDKTIASYNSGNSKAIAIRDDSFSDASALKTALSGTYLVYEKATPTTETATPFQSPMLTGSTEEYVTTGVVPVGHESRYYEDITGKVNNLPSDFSTLIAPVEKSFTATRNYTVGSFVIVNNQLYKVSSAISSGGTITPNSNVTATTIMAEILALA